MKKNKSFLLMSVLGVSITMPIAVVACGTSTNENSFIDLSQTLNKFKDSFLSSKNAADLKAALKDKNVGDEVSVEELGITIPTTLSNINASFKIKHAYNDASKKVVIVLSIFQNDINSNNLLGNVKDIIVYADDSPTIPVDVGQDVDNFAIKTIDDLKSKYKYYDSLKNGLRGMPLFNALHSIQLRYKNGIGSYNDLWSTYQKAFLDKYDEKDDTIYDIYSEKVGQKDDFEFTPGFDQDKGSGSSVGEFYNREHIIPQSYFGKKSRKVHDDAHFVYPADKKINGLRGHLVHDEITGSATKDGVTIGGNDWKIGQGVHGESSVFEPDDNFKGDIARAYMYYQLTWYDFSRNPSGDFKDKNYPAFTNMFPYFKKDYLKMYIKWSNDDPIDQFNIDVNNKVAESQGGIRNPFVDMPYLITLIWG